MYRDNPVLKRNLRQPRAHRSRTAGTSRRPDNAAPRQKQFRLPRKLLLSPGRVHHHKRTGRRHRQKLFHTVQKERKPAEINHQFVATEPAGGSTRNNDHSQIGNHTRATIQRFRRVGR